MIWLESTAQSHLSAALRSSSTVSSLVASRGDETVSGVIDEDSHAIILQFAKITASRNIEVWHEKYRHRLILKS
jgi:hypothetical protein